MSVASIQKLPAHPGMANVKDIKEWRKLLRAHREELLEATSGDTGRDVAETFLVEWSAVDSALSFLEETVDELFAPRPLKSSLKRMLGSRTLIQRRIPFGKALVVGTWNFPLALHLPQILFAMASGNKVVFKPSPLTPALAKALKKCLEPAFKGRFTVWQPGDQDEVLRAVRKGEFQMLVFTGGTSGARAFAMACGESMTPLICEASGSEVAIMLEKANAGEADIEETLDHLLWAAFHHSGQTCVSPRFWFVPCSILGTVWKSASRLLDEGDDSLRSRVGLKLDKVAEEHQAWVAWAQLLPGAHRYRSKLRPEFSLIRVDSIASVPTETEPTFGPAVVIAGYESVFDAVQWVRSSKWSLMTSVFGEPTEALLRQLDGLDASIVSFNESVISSGDASIPFGGRGTSGFGVCHGVDGLMALSRSQTWVDVRHWPGLGVMRPGWKRLGQLLRAGSWLKDLDRRRPLEAAKEWFGRGLNQIKKEISFGNSDS